MIWLPFFLSIVFEPLAISVIFQSVAGSLLCHKVEDTCLGWCTQKYRLVRTVRLMVDSTLRLPGSPQGSVRPSYVCISPLGVLNSNSL